MHVLRTWAFSVYRMIWRRLSPYRKLILAMPGLATLNRAVASRLRVSDELTVRVRGLSLRVRGDDLVGRQLLAHGDWESYESHLFASVIKPGMTVVDAGAYIGYYSLIAAPSVGASGRVLAFEPSPDNFSLLRENLARNGAIRVEAHPIALSDKAGTVPLFLGTASNQGKASFSDLNASADFMLAPTERLDAFVEHVDVLKLDVEGAEGLALNGTTSLPSRIFMEFWPLGLTRVGTDPAELLQDLRQMGFVLNIIDEDERSLRPFDTETALRAEQLNLFCELHSRSLPSWSSPS